MQEEALAKIRQYIKGRVAHTVLSTDDAWQHELKDLLPLFVMFQILDRLESIDDSLAYIMNEIHQGQHEK